MDAKIVNLILSKVEILKLKANDYSWQCETPKEVRQELEEVLALINKELSKSKNKGEV